MQEVVHNYKQRADPERIVLSISSTTVVLAGPGSFPSVPPNPAPLTLKSPACEATTGVRKSTLLSSNE